jgi:hypothetical protein
VEERQVVVVLVAVGKAAAQEGRSLSSDVIQ